jgi:hypothetical protein
MLATLLTEERRINPALDEYLKERGWATCCRRAGCGMGVPSQRVNFERDLSG